MAKVLVGCEFSGVVRQAFRARGHDAWSCDLLPAEDGSPFHYQGDVLDVLTAGWDIAIFHPPCNHLASSGAQYWPAKQADGRQAAALAFVLTLARAPIPRIALENPVGILGAAFRPADQIVQPWQFGDPYNKKTCLWLKDLPPLQPTRLVEPTHNWGTNSYQSGRRKRSPLPGLHSGVKDRSRSFPGLAAAMAAQWGAPDLPLQASFWGQDD